MASSYVQVLPNGFIILDLKYFQPKNQPPIRHLDLRLAICQLAKDFSCISLTSCLSSFDHLHSLVKFRHFIDKLRRRGSCQASLPPGLHIRPTRDNIAMPDIKYSRHIRNVVDVHKAKSGTSHVVSSRCTQCLITNIKMFFQSLPSCCNNLFIRDTRLVALPLLDKAVNQFAAPVQANVPDQPDGSIHRDRLRTGLRSWSGRQQ